MKNRRVIGVFAVVLFGLAFAAGNFYGVRRIYREPSWLIGDRYKVVRTVGGNVGSSYTPEAGNICLANSLDLPCQPMRFFAVFWSSDFCQSAGARQDTKPLASEINIVQAIPVLTRRLSK